MKKGMRGYKEVGGVIGHGDVVYVEKIRSHLGYGQGTSNCISRRARRGTYDSAFPLSYRIQLAFATNRWLPPLQILIFRAVSAAILRYSAFVSLKIERPLCHGPRGIFPDCSCS